VSLLASELLGSANAYGVGGTHRHLPEIAQNLRAVGATEVRHGDQVMVEVSWPLRPQAIMVATRVPDAREAEVGVS